MSRTASQVFDVVIIGAGAAGMMCGIEAGRRGRRVLILEKARKTGQKILISGGGRCNFTNMFAAPDRFLSQNRHFCKSALRQFTQTDFIRMVEAHSIAYHEKKLGQLFCDGSASQITEMLETACEDVNVAIWCDAGADKVKKKGELFEISVGNQVITTRSVVIASGGLSIPKMGANDFAYRVAAAFDLELATPRPGLVPLTFEMKDMKRFADLAGVSADVDIRCNKTHFRENLLFTHRGLSGPAILQISSFWQLGQSIFIDFLPDLDLESHLKELRRRQPKAQIVKILSEYLASRLIPKLLGTLVSVPEMGNCSDQVIGKIAASLKQVEITPNGSEGYRKAEVTVGGVSTNELSSKTMEAKKAPGLYFIGEAVDVTGFLGGYNFQWAWSSGYVAGQYA
ncbi:NAD(P)/FAD-dependent oxidoreductase [Sneathiella marina]|uniref:NAD(P)/FAD-dependent oxidoreductase n=1 Tax=Sneathiella marina TaxID=2950108 RepID=A0ABY4WA32_9PROT|nr:NAD(P)/FAD-dependent oxidoreductase [Sneathiella marina]USG62134.1 NAD(P)/FAD-dependent oxidoreductase [Sneathiella marina]